MLWVIIAAAAIVAAVAAFVLFGGKKKDADEHRDMSGFENPMCVTPIALLPASPLLNLLTQ
jgi:hypothetical protein